MGGYISVYSGYASKNGQEETQILQNNSNHPTKKKKIIISSIEEDLENPAEENGRRNSGSASGLSVKILGKRPSFRHGGGRKRQDSTTSHTSVSASAGIDVLIETEQLCPTIKQYEIDINNVQIGEICSSEFDGTFGRIVKHGSISNLYFTNELTSVIIKQSSAATTSSEEWKSFLREINLLSWIGWHEFIVAFLGVAVGDLSRMELYMICEHPKNGFLRGYLRSEAEKKELLRISERNRLLGAEADMDFLHHENGSYSSECLVQFAQWIHQICEAMEFLGSRRVIVASDKVVLIELTASSVQLTENLTAKLANFTLARSLKSDEDHFILAEQLPLPWRWLAPESFESFKFSPETDIWAFGILIWEIFSYGQHPYSGFQFSDIFITNLKEGGLRPRRLANMSAELYEFLESCWEVAPELRPNFTNSSLQLSEIFSRY